MKFKVVEIFASLEGEGSLMGTYSTFVRLFGCNLRCSWCDTKNSYEPFGTYSLMSIGPIQKKVAKFDSELVTITGGEPLLHDNISDLIKAFIADGKMVKIETNGTLWQNALDTFGGKLFVSCSLKPPKYALDPMLATIINEFKFVVDYALTIEDILRHKKQIDQGVAVVLQLLDNEEFSLIKALGMQKDLVKMGIKARVLPQIHKLLAIE